MARINRGVNSPINCLNSSLLANLHVAPHTGAHVCVCGLPTTWPHPVHLLRGPPGRCHVASVPRRNYITWAHYTPGPITCQLKDRLATWCPPDVRVDSHGLAERPRHITVMQALAWVCVALPRGLACHVASVRVPCCPTSARSSCGKITPFLPFYKSIKIR